MRLYIKIIRFCWLFFYRLAIAWYRQANRAQPLSPRARACVGERAGKISSECGKYCGPATANGPTISFSSFRNSFTSNVNYLKRRFSSGDLSSECDGDESQVDPYTKAPPVTSQPQVRQRCTWITNLVMLHFDSVEYLFSFCMNWKLVG